MDENNTGGTIVTLREAIYNYLSGYTGLTDLVSTRIYSQVMPQGVVYPAVTYQVISPGTVNHLMNSDSGLYKDPQVQVSSWASTQSSGDAVAVQVSAALKDYSGTMGGDGGITVQRVFLLTPQPLELPQSGGNLFQYVHDFRVVYT